MTSRREREEDRGWGCFRKEVLSYGFWALSWMKMTNKNIKSTHWKLYPVFSEVWLIQSFKNKMTQEVVTPMKIGVQSFFPVIPVKIGMTRTRCWNNKKSRKLSFYDTINLYRCNQKNMSLEKISQITTEIFTSPHSLKTAVLFMVFNRPDTTKQVFEAIHQAKPPYSR